MSSAGALRWLGYLLRCGFAVEKDRDSREDKEMQFAGFTYRIWLRANDGDPNVNGGRWSGVEWITRRLKSEPYHEEQS